jgi:hypothetical protein
MSLLKAALEGIESGNSIDDSFVNESVKKAEMNLRMLRRGNVLKKVSNSN